MYRQFESDPFFSGFHDRRGGMDDMFAFRSPFQALDYGGNSEYQRQHPGHYEMAPHRSQRGSQMMPMVAAFDPFGFMNSMMSNMNSMMGNMFRQMEDMQNDPNGHSFMHSSVMTYTNDGSGQPKIYQATTSTRQAPGGIRETRKAVRDSEAGIEKMAIGRHLDDRAHIITRQRSTRTGDIDENQDYINLDESEAEQFNDDWTRRTRQFSSQSSRNLRVGQPHSSQARALDNRPHGSRHDTEATATRPAPGQHKSTDHSRKPANTKRKELVFDRTR